MPTLRLLDRQHAMRENRNPPRTARGRLLELLAGQERTVAMEWLLALLALVIGLWTLSPWWTAFGPDGYLQRFPETAVGLVLAGHGAAHVWALGPPVRVHWCRRAALASVGTWTTMALAYAWIPPHTLWVVPLSSGLAGASFWVYLRLYLRYA